MTIEELRLFIKKEENTSIYKIDMLCNFTCIIFDNGPHCVVIVVRMMLLGSLVEWLTSDWLF